MSRIVRGNFPIWKYHHSKGAVLVHNEAELRDLGSGWVNSESADPLTVARSQEEYLARKRVPEVPEENLTNPLHDLDKDELRKMADERGIKVHHKAGKEKLIQALSQ